MFEKISRGTTYSRQELAKLWGYAGTQAIARGVVTPRGTNKIILFVTQEKQSSYVPYQDRLTGTSLHWEGPTDHFAEQRLVNAGTNGDTIHLFYRERHHSDFIYVGELALVSYTLHTDKPSSFVFRVL